MTDIDTRESETPGDEAPSKLSSLMLGDTQPTENVDVTNVPALVALVSVFVFLGVVNLVYLAFALGLVLMIFLHELGHYMTAKWTGMKVTQFFIGMGPTIISRTKGEVEYGIKALPIGAFVRIIGMTNLDPVDPEDEPRAYRNKSYPRKMLVITAGSMMHFIQAILIFGLALSVIGVPNRESNEWTVGEISRLETGETPSVEAGLELGDRVTEIDGVVLDGWTDLVETVRARPGEVVTLTVVRGDDTFTTTTTLATVPTDDGGEVGFLGIYRTFPRERENISQAFIRSYETGELAIVYIPERLLNPARFTDLVDWAREGAEPVSIESEEAQNRPVSLVGAVRLSGDVAEIDPVLPLLLLASLNVFIGVFNLFPLLPLDGGHAAVATYERIRTRDTSKPYRADINKLLPLTYVVVAVMAFLTVATLYLDIARPIGISS